MIKRFLSILFIVLAFALGVGLTYTFFNQDSKEERQVESTVLLEKVRKVCKLVTVEGQFSELYDETNIREMTFYLPLPSTWKFSKKAIIRVEGTVLVGYDMDDIEVEADSASQTIRVSNLPEPALLSIDHAIKYENLEESFFNSFTPADYTALNKKAKEVLREKALESRLLEEASQQGNQLLEVMKFMAEASGWTLEIVSDDPAILLQN